MIFHEFKQLWSEPIEQWESCNEGFTHFNAVTSFQNVCVGDFHKLSQFLLLNKSFQDKIVISFSGYNGAEFTQLTNKMEDGILSEGIKEIIDKLDDRQDGDIAKLKIDIYKSGEINSAGFKVHQVYSLSAMESYLETLKLLDLNEQFFKHFYSSEISGCVFLVHEDIQDFNTEYFYFVAKKDKHYSELKNIDNTDKYSKLIKIRAEVGHFSNAAQWPWTPEHFKFIHRPAVNNKILCEIFNALHNVSLLSFISNYLYIELNSASTSLKGVKSISEEYSLEDLKIIDAIELWKIYLWVYDLNSSTDKLGIARNIIPLHSDRVLLINKKVYESALSSYELSLKENVKSYIEVTNKLAEQVQLTSQKANEIVDKISNAIKTGLWGVTTFTVSTFLMRIMSKSESLSSFNELLLFLISPIFILLISFSLVAFTALFFLAYKESLVEQRRYKEMYISMKEVYLAILTKADINNILSNDEHFNMNYQFVERKRKIYLKLWLITISIITSVIFLCVLLSKIVDLGDIKIIQNEYFWFILKKCYLS